ncbi:unnamed protein product [Ectocarpus sp. 13 AM-2016]
MSREFRNCEISYSPTRFYGDLGHDAFKSFCRSGFKLKDSSLKLLISLEGRFDMFLYRLGFFHSL